MRKTYYAVLFGLLNAAAPFAQSSIDESAVAKTVWADPVSGSDANDGSMAKPFLTLGKAIKACKGTPSKVMLKPGYYRESVYEQGNTTLLVIESQLPGRAVITGSDLWNDGWAKDAATGYFTHAWTYKWGTVDPGFGVGGQVADTGKRRELVFVNGAKMATCMTTNMMAGYDGAVAVDESAGKIYLKPPAGVSMANATIEVAVRGFNTYGSAPNGSILRFDDFSNLVLRGLVVQHAVSVPHQAACELERGSNFLIEDCKFLWNNGVGLDMGGVSDVTVRNCVGNWNGERGLGAYGQKNFLWESCEASHNNWRYGAPLQGHDAAGLKMLEATNVRIRHLRALANDACGIWFDWNNNNLLMDSCNLVNNGHQAIALEASPGPTLISNSVLRNSREELLLYGSRKVTVKNCDIIHRRKSQWEPCFLTVTDDRTASFYPDNKLRVDSSQILNCRIDNRLPYPGSDDMAYLFAASTFGNGSFIADLQFASTVRSDSNQWYSDNFRSANFFESDSTVYQAWHKNWSTDYWKQDMPWLDFATWKKKTGQDQHSTWGPIDTNLTDPSRTAQPRIYGLPVALFVGCQPRQVKTAKLALSNRNRGTLAYTLTSDSPWLTLPQKSGSVTAGIDSVQVNCDASALQAGTYLGAITVTANGAEQPALTVPVYFRVASGDNSPPTLVSADSVLAAPGRSTVFTARAVDPDIDPVSYQFDYLPSWATKSSDSTLTLSPKAGDQDGIFRVIAKDGRGGADTLMVRALVRATSGLAARADIAAWPVSLRAGDGDIMLDVATADPRTVEVEAFGADGARAVARTLTLGNGAASVRINDRRLRAGIYLVRVTVSRKSIQRWLALP